VWARARGWSFIIPLVPEKRIENRGSHWVPDAEGFLPTRSDQRPIAEPWASAVALVVDAYRDRLGPALHSVYVRGSVARGLAVEGVSDLDTFAVLVPCAPPELDPSAFASWSSEVDARVTARHPAVVGVETDLVRYDQVVRGRGYFAFALKTEAACVHGPDLADQVAPFRLGPDVAFQTKFFRKHLAIFRREYPSEPPAERPGFIAWLARRLLRLGMELVMLQEGRYSRDLDRCYESFARYYPAQAEAMRRALELAVNPTADAASARFLTEFGEWLAGLADQALLAWGLAPEPSPAAS